MDKIDGKPYTTERNQSGSLSLHCWDNRRRTHFGCDGGEFLGTVLLFLSFMGMFFICFYAAIYYHAYSVVNAAAQDGLRAAQLYGNDLEDGVLAAENILGLAHLTQTSVTVNADGSMIQTNVSGNIASPVFGWSATVVGEARGPKERYIVSTEQRPGYTSPP